MFVSQNWLVYYQANNVMHFPIKTKLSVLKIDIWPVFLLSLRAGQWAGWEGRSLTETIL